MPRRRNLFQDVVAIIQQHLAGDATVEESALVPHAITGALREVDVVIRSTIAGYPLVIGVEATGGGRAATVEWVERMVQKHRGLGTDKLVLVSQSDFSADARHLAEGYGAIPMSPEILGPGDRVGSVISSFRTLRPKFITPEVEQVELLLEASDGSRHDLVGGPDAQVFFEDGTVAGTLQGLVIGVLNSDAIHSLAAQSGLDAIDDTVDRPFAFATDNLADREHRKLFLRRVASPDGSLEKIVRLEVHGTYHIRIQELTLSEGRLGEVQFAHGTTSFAGKNALVVVTEDVSGARLTVRLSSPPGNRPRPTDGETSGG